MTEETIILSNIETKSTKAGQPMWTAMTNSGKMSVFDKALADVLFTNVRKTMIVDVETNGAYKNLTKFIRLADVQQASQPVQSSFREDPKEKKVSVCLSYAKDLAAAGKIEVKDIEETAKEFLSMWDKLLQAEFG